MEKRNPQKHGKPLVDSAQYKRLVRDFIQCRRRIIMKICMAAYVFGDYTRYIAYYVYSVLKSYSDYYVKVFTRDSLSPNEKKCIALIRDQVSPNFEVIESYFDESLHLEKPTKMVGGIETTFRFLLPSEAFKNFKFAYIGDVDFLIIRETPSLING